MKFIIIISFLVTILVVSNSCQDSLGIESNVIRTKLDTTQQDTTHKDSTIITKVAAIIDNVSFYEIWDTGEKSYDIDAAIGRAKAYVDTASTPPMVWIELRLDNLNSDTLYQDILKRTYYTQTLQLTVDSMPAAGTFHLNGSKTSGFWSEIVRKNILTNDSTYLSGSDTGFEISFNVQSKGIILVQTTAKIKNPYTDNDFVTVKGSFRIIYPKE